MDHFQSNETGSTEEEAERKGKLCHSSEDG